MPGNNSTHETDVLTQYVYDVVGNRIVITNALAFTSSLTLYNDLNRPIVITDALGNETHLSYYALGQRHTVVDANGETTRYSYDALGRVSQVQYLADGETASYTYDARGNVLTMNDSLGQTSYEYDGFGRLITVTNPFDEQIVYGYDQVGNRTSLTYPDGKLVQYTYDADNRLVEVLDWEGGVTSYTYDEIGRLTTTTLPNHVQTHYTYDDANRLIHLLHVNEETGELIAEYEYLLDSVGNRLQTIERFRLPTTTLPGGQATNAPLDAEAVLTSIQPPDPAKEMRLARNGGNEGQSPAYAALIIGNGGNEGQSPSYSVFITPTVPLTAGIPLSDVIAFTDTLPFTETVPFDPAAIVEQAENSIQTPPGETPYVAQETHEITFEEGSITFVVITETSSISQTATPSPLHPLTFTVPPTLTVALAEIAVGNHTLFSGPDTTVPDFEANIARFDLGNGLTEEFVARNAGVEQRWWISENPDLSGDLTIEVEVVTPLTLTIGGDGFVFVAHTADNQIPVLQYARAVAIDAAENSYWAHLSAEIVASDAQGNHTYRLQMTFPADWLATAQYPLLVDPLISPVLRLGHESPANDQTAPQVAYNPVDDEYLLVWQDGRNNSTTGFDIYAQRVDGDGSLIGNNYILNNTQYDQTNPQVEYGGGVYLVVWRDFTTANGGYVYDMRGQLLSGTGQLTGGVLTIDAEATEAEFPTDVVYNTTSSQFLTLWQNRSASGNWNTLGRHVTTSGVVNGTTLSFATGSCAETSARGVYNPTLDQYLVTWAYWCNPNRDIRGRLLTGSTMGAELVIANHSSFQDLPDVVYLAEANRYLVVWHDDRNAATNGYDIYAQKVNPTSSLDGSNYPVVNGNASEERPRLAAGADNTVFVLWQRNDGGSPDWNLYGRLLTPNGLTAADSFATAYTKANQSMPAIAGDGHGNYLTTWQDDRNGNSDVYGRWLVPDGPFGGDFMVHPTPGDQKDPQVAYNPDNNEYLVVWEHFTTDLDVYGQRLSGDGELIGDNILLAGGADSQASPRVAYSNGQYLLVWLTVFNNSFNVQGRFLSATGQLGSIFDIATSSHQWEVPTDVVFNPTHNKFLVLWHDVVFQKDIWGQHVLPDGSTETAIQLTSDAAEEDDAVAVYNPVTDEYLITWQYKVTSNNYEVYGRRVNSHLVEQGAVIPVATGNRNQWQSDVVYLPTSQRYLVVWVELNDIYGRLYTSDGTPDGSSYVISAQTGSEEYPKVALNSLGSALVVWQAYQFSNGYAVYGRQLDNQGQSTGNSFAIVDMENHQKSPVLASNGQTDYLVVWQDDRVSGWDAYAALLEPPIQETVITYSYDPLYRLTAADYHGSLNATYQYQYDAVGNRTTYISTITTTQITTYTYNAANQLIQAKLDTSPDTWYYEYDGNGNQTRQAPNGLAPAAGEVRYIFDQRNLLTRVETHNGTFYQLQAELFYDGEGNRLQTVAYIAGAPLTTTYTLDNQNGAVLVVSDGSESTLLLYGLFSLGEYGTEWSYYLGDASFSVRQLVADDGKLLFARTYDPFGGTLHISGSGSSLYGFAGTQGGVGGLLYINGRYFDPRTGRFLSPGGNFDPMRPGTLNGYVVSSLMANPIMALLPVLTVFHWRKRRNGKSINRTDLFLLGLFVMVGLSACEGQTPQQTPNASDITQGTPISTPSQTPVPINTVASAATQTPTLPTSTLTPFPTATCTPTPSATSTSTSTPTVEPTPIPTLPPSIWQSFPVRTMNGQPDWIQWYGYTERAATRVYGGNALRVHAGLDFGVYYDQFKDYNSETGEGIPVYGAAYGTVFKTGTDSQGLGRVEISFGNGLTGYYDHLDLNHIKVVDGQSVDPDTIIGYLETTERHLHLELREGVTVRNPLPYFSEGPRNIMVEWVETRQTQYMDNWQWFDPLDQPPTTYTTPTPTSSNP